VLGQPSQQQQPQGQRAKHPEDEIRARLSFYGAGMKDAYVVGMGFGVDSRWVGLDANVDAIASETVTGPIHHDPSDPAVLGSAHLTWSLVSTQFARIRVLTGASMLKLPQSQFTASQPWAGKDLFGADIGASGGFGLLGPVAVEGWARFTLMPVVIADTYAGLALHGGPIGLTAGWRWIDVRGDGIDAPKFFFRGPQGGLSIRF